MAGLLVGVAFGLFLVLLGWFRRRTVGPARRLKNGWRALRPRWFVRALIAAIVVLFGFSLAGVFWSGEIQPNSGPLYGAAAIAAAIALGIAALIMVPLWGRTVVWNDTELRVRTLLGRETGGRFADVGLIRYDERKGLYTVTFLNGERVEFKEIMHGTRELLERLPRNALPQ